MQVLWAQNIQRLWRQYIHCLVWIIYTLFVGEMYTFICGDRIYNEFVQHITHRFNSGNNVCWFCVNLKHKVFKNTKYTAFVVTLYTVLCGERKCNFCKCLGTVYIVTLSFMLTEHQVNMKTAYITFVVTDIYSVCGGRICNFRSEKVYPVRLWGRYIQYLWGQNMQLVFVGIEYTAFVGTIYILYLWGQNI